jgi:hypothetical protein
MGVRGRLTSSWKYKNEGGRLQTMRFRLCIAWTVTCVGVKDQIDQRNRDNRRINTDETASEVSIGHEKKQHKNVLRRNRKYSILMEVGNIELLRKWIKIRMIM